MTVAAGAEEPAMGGSGDELSVMDYLARRGQYRRLRGQR